VWLFVSHCGLLDVSCFPFKGSSGWSFLSFVPSTALPPLSDIGFTRFNQSLYDYLDFQIQKRKSAKVAATKAESAGKWGVQGDQIDGVDSPDVLLSNLSKQLVIFQGMADEWGQQLRIFMRGLKSSNREAAERIQGGLNPSGSLRPQRALHLPPL